MNINNLLKVAMKRDEIQTEINDLTGHSISKSGAIHVDKVIDLIEAFDDCVGYSNNRRSKVLIWRINKVILGRCIFD